MRRPPSKAPESPAERRLGLALLWGILLLGLLPRAWLAFHDDGLYWPDEIYQSLEPAHRLVFGYGLVAWEFVEGARSWAFPGLVAGLLELCRLLGLTEPRAYLTGVRLAFCAVGAATPWAAFRLARVQGASTLASALGASAFALAAPAIYFAPRALSELASALPMALGLAFGFDPEAGRTRRLLGASLLGLSVLLRLQNGLFCIALLVLLLIRRHWRQALEALGVLLGWAVLFGLLDRLTWGDWFHSAFVYLRYNLIEGRGAAWGVAGPDYYVRVLSNAMPPLSLCLLLLGLWGARRNPGLFLTALAFVAAHSLIPHKELRFILPALPIACAAAALGLDALPRPGPRWALGGLLLASGLGSAGAFHLLTFGQLGAYEDSRPNVSAYDDAGPVNRLLLAAHQQPDLCGLEVEATHLAWTGGATYLHRPVPIYPHTGPPRGSRRYNYVITVDGRTQGGEVVAQEGGVLLLRLPWTTCEKDPEYQWRLP